MVQQQILLQVISLPIDALGLRCTLACSFRDGRAFAFVTGLTHIWAATVGYVLLVESRKEKPPHKSGLKTRMDM